MKARGEAQSGARTAVHPLSALALAAFLTVLAYAVPRAWGALVALVAALLIATLSGVGSRALLLSLAVGLPTFALLFLMNGIVAIEGLPVIAVGPIAVAPASAPAAARIALRLAAAIAALGWLVLVVAPRRLARALAERGFPSWSAYLLVASLDAVPQARRRAVEVLEAQRARGLRPGRGAKRLRALLPTAGPLAVSLVSETEDRALALEARGFKPNAPRSAFHPEPDSRAGRVARSLLWIGTVALIVWRLIQASD